MRSLYLAGFSQAERAKSVTGKLTDLGAQREDISLVTLGGEDTRYTLHGEGVLSARLRLDQGESSLTSCLCWIGLESDRAEVLTELVKNGGGLVVVAAPTGELGTEQLGGFFQVEKPSDFTEIKILGTSSEPSLQVRTTVGESPASLQVYGMRESVAVERRKVRRAATEQDLEFFREAVHEFFDTEQTLEVRAVPYVVEEVVVNVTRQLQEHEIEGRIRQMRAELDEL